MTDQLSNPFKTFKMPAVNPSLPRATNQIEYARQLRREAPLTITYSSMGRTTPKSTRAQIEAVRRNAEIRKSAVQKAQWALEREESRKRMMESTHDFFGGIAMVDDPDYRQTIAPSTKMSEVPGYVPNIGTVVPSDFDEE